MLILEPDWDSFLLPEVIWVLNWDSFLLPLMILKLDRDLFDLPVKLRARSQESMHQ
jgi:hypothetical protein